MKKKITYTVTALNKPCPEAIRDFNKAICYMILEDFDKKALNEKTAKGEVTCHEEEDYLYSNRIE